MGLGDVLRGLFSRRDAPVRTLVLLPDEAEVARAVGTWRTGTLASIDGYLVLTTGRLLFVSEASGGTDAVLTWSLRASSHQHGTLAAAQVGADSSLISPPSLVLVDTVGHRVEIGILANRLTPNLSGANAVARDRVVVTIRSAILAAARQVPRQPSRPDQFTWFTDGP